MSNDDLLIGLALWLLGKGGKGSSAPAETKRVAADDGQKLVARATQDATKKWVALFQQADVPQLLAEALARWAGIESSGNPTAVSSLGERGLLQLGKAMQSDGALSQAEYDKLIAPGTTNEEHARLAYKLANWITQRALKHVKNPPTDYISAVWYAKLYHQWPVDVRDGGMHGPAALMARELADRWKADAKRMHRLRAANVVAWGTPEPPPTVASR